MIAMRWSARLMGLVSMVVVARLLTPADFGIYAIAITFIGLLDALSDFGTDTAIIRHRNPGRAHYDTAWTVGVVGHLVIAALIAAFAPLAVHLYDDARLQPVMLVLALAALLTGFTNIGIADFRRNLDFGKDFKFNVLVQLCGVAATIGFAILLRDYWALVLGGLVRSIARVLVGYSMHAYRPRFSLAARSELLGFSIWTMIRSGAQFVSGRAERLIVGAYYGPALTGLYTVASDFAAMIVFELLHPIGRALFPGMAIKQGDRDWEKRSLPIVFSISATLAMAMGLGLAAIAKPAMELVFGSQFADGGAYLAIFSVQMALAGLLQPVSLYLIVNANTAFSILLLIQGACVLTVTAVLAALKMPLETVIYANFAVNLLAFSQLALMLRLVGDNLRWFDVARIWFRPITSGIVMLLVVSQVVRAVDSSPALAVACGGLVGAVIFLATLFGLWQLSHRPDGFEERVSQMLLKYYRRAASS
jgi:O-antigen/teichoic acid export membrane protein